MPTYEYKCKHCGHSFEEFQAITEESLSTCPKCGKNALARMLGTGGGVIFKGSGFYLTDYRKEKPKEDSPKPKSSNPEKKETPPSETPKSDKKE
jgi:putative FmdB family regulatory protein